MHSKTHIFLLILFTLLLTSFEARSIIWSEKDALLRFKSGVGKYVLAWEDDHNKSSSSSCCNHCFWQGVFCEDGVVTGLLLPNVGLTGVTPDNVFPYLTKLHTLNLGHNNLSGPLPKLDNHHLLRRLLLEKNKFSGMIPADLDVPSSLRHFNVSYNQLTGPIPLKLRSMPAESFLGMTSLYRVSYATDEPPPYSWSSPYYDHSWSPPYYPYGFPHTEQRNGLSTGAIVGITVFGCALGIILLICCCRCINKQNGAQTSATQDDIELGTSANANVVVEVSTSYNKNEVTFFGGGHVELKYDVKELLAASAVLLGKGMFGTSYKVSLDVGAVFAVKIMQDVDVPEMKFRKLIEAIGVIEHPNLVAMRGYHFDNNHKLLLYDYMPKGSLFTLIHDNRDQSERAPLDWRTRLRTACAVASGIAYIHSIDPPINTHGNIKSSNILLDEHEVAHVSEQCITQLVRREKILELNGCYVAPEVIIDAREFSHKTDVYSFGVVLLELITGKAPDRTFEDKGVSLTEWVGSIEHNELLVEVFDLELLYYPDTYQQIMKLLDLAMECVEHCPNKRPTVSEIEARLERIR